MKIQENFQQSVQQQIKEDIEETIQEELENNLDDTMNESSIRVFQDHQDDLPDIVVTGVSKTGLVNDPAGQLLHDESNHAYRQENFHRR